MDWCFQENLRVAWIASVILKSKHGEEKGNGKRNLQAIQFNFFFFFPWTVEYYPKFIHALLAADQVLMTASKRP